MLSLRHLDAGPPSLRRTWQQNGSRDEYWKETNKNGSIRKNYAGINHQYDSTRDVFIGVQPYSSWTLNETTCQWEAPVVEPDDGKRYTWNEDTTNWVEIT